MRAKRFSAEHDAWLREHNSPAMTIRELTSKYNHVFGESRSDDVMKSHCREVLGLKRADRGYTAEMDEWLCENAPTHSAKDTAWLFNKHFNANRSTEAIKVRCNKILKTGFKNIKNDTSKQVGTEVLRSGYVWVKVARKKPRPGERSAEINWRPKAHIVWEKHYGQMPPSGHTIVFLDGNRQNVVIENLYAVSGVVNREMSKKSWWSTNGELTLTAIKWCELLYAVKEIKTNNMDMSEKEEV